MKTLLAVDRNADHPDSGNFIIIFDGKINRQARCDRIVNTEFFDAYGRFPCLLNGVFPIDIKRFVESGIGINGLSRPVTNDDDCFCIMQTYPGLQG